MRAEGRKQIGHGKPKQRKASLRTPQDKPRPAKPKQPTLDLAIRADAGKPYVAYLRKYLSQAHEISHSRLAELSVALVGDKRMSQLHEQFMGIAGPTDVLSFPLDMDRRGRVTGGEIVICVPEAKRQARQRGLTIQQELLLYAIHGMLHLNGFDDRTDAEYRKMHRTEDRILMKLGIGATFAPGMLKPTGARTPSKGDSCC